MTTVEDFIKFLCDLPMSVPVYIQSADEQGRPVVTHCGGFTVSHANKWAAGTAVLLCNTGTVVNGKAAP